jgi:broad specificity phosphatase PhoE
MIRHLDRIDGDDCSVPEMKLWNSTHRKDPMFKINPYICKSQNKLSSLVKSLNENGVEINRVFCSPFLRCIETAILLTNSCDKIKDKTINIDFNLSEFLNEDLMFTYPVDLKAIYEHSKSYLSANFSDKPYTLKELKTDLTMESSESEEAYKVRINTEVKFLRNNYEGNILIVTHADAYRQYNSEDKNMKYGEVYELSIPVEKKEEVLVVASSDTVEKSSEIDSDEGGYYKKYLKYKMKYLKLKHNL